MRERSHPSEVTEPGGAELTRPSSSLQTPGLGTAEAVQSPPPRSSSRKASEEGKQEGSPHFSEKGKDKEARELTEASTSF